MTKATTIRFTCTRSKIDWLRELVESLDGEPLLIAYEFIEDLRTIRRAFGEVPALGGLTPARRGDAAGRGLERGDAAAARLSSGLGGARAQPAARRVAHGVAVAELVGRTHRAGDRADLPAGADAARDHSRLRRRRHRRRDEARSGARQDERAGSVQAASGAGLMQERTAFRLAMLANGYWPLLNDCKKAIEQGWPKRRPDEAEILSWDRSALLSTGLKLDGDLAVIDVDVSEAALVEALGGRPRQELPRAVRARPGAPRRRAEGSLDRARRRAVPAARLAALVSRQRSGRSRGAEAYGRMLRFARDAAVRDRRAAYPPPGRGDQHLPVCRRRLAGDDAAGVAAGAAEGGLRAGLRPVRRDRRGGGAHRASRRAGPAEARRRARCFELDADTEIETRDHGAMTVAELERLMRARQARADAPATLRCSGSFHDPTRVRTDSHLINWGRYGLGIYDTMTETTWHRRERAPSARFEFLGQLQARNPFR